LKKRTKKLLGFWRVIWGGGGGSPAALFLKKGRLFLAFFA
jgi:hypothetical protein